MPVFMFERPCNSLPVYEVYEVYCVLSVGRPKPKKTPFFYFPLFCSAFTFPVYEVYQVYEVYRVYEREIWEKQAQPSHLYFSLLHFYYIGMTTKKKNTKSKRSSKSSSLTGRNNPLLIKEQETVSN